MQQPAFQFNATMELLPNEWSLLTWFANKCTQWWYSTPSRGPYSQVECNGKCHRHHCEGNLIPTSACSISARQIRLAGLEIRARYHYPMYCILLNFDLYSALYNAMYIVDCAVMSAISSLHKLAGGNNKSMLRYLTLRKYIRYLVHVYWIDLFDYLFYK